MRLLLTAAIAAFGHIASAAFTPLSANETFAKMTPGWNLGNTLDAIPTEGSWSSPAQNVTFTQIYADGFRSVRIPVTYVDHYVSDAPDYTINATWLARVSYVVDAAISSGLFVVVNVHHDSWNWADMSGSKPDLDARKAKFEKTWQQIGTVLKDKSEKLLFESLNEPVGTTQADADVLNDINLRFLNVVRNTGGNNPQRVMSLPGLNDNSVHLTDWFVPPNNYTSDKWSVQFHYYSPWDFVSNSWGRTFWGSDADKAAVVNDMTPVRGNFSVPILIGEYGTSSVGTIVEKAAGWAWYDHVVRTAVGLSMVPQWWDNGGEFFDRATGTWHDVTVKNIVIAAAAGKVNTIPYSGNGTIWLKSGATVPPPIYLQYNGNTLNGIYNPSGEALAVGKDYTVITTPLTGFALSSAYVASLNSTTALGELGRVIVRSSAGADLEIDVRRYSRPVVSTGTINISGNTNDYYLDYVSNGAKLATVKATGPSGEYVKDDWTQWLGEPQAGRINWGDFGAADELLIIYSSLVSYIKNYGKPVTLTWEFWPRTDLSNNVTTVVTVT